MKFKLLLFAISFIACTTNTAQAAGKKALVIGSVTYPTIFPTCPDDSACIQGGITRPVPFARVIVVKNDKSFSRVITTDEKGKFEIKLLPGQYKFSSGPSKRKQVITKGNINYTSLEVPEVYIDVE